MDQNFTNNTNISSPFIHFNEELERIRPIFIILQSIIGSITIFISIIVLTLFYCSKYKSKGSSRRFFIALTISDLQCGVICTISFNYVVQGMQINDPYCMKAITAVYYSLYVTFFLLVAMTIDRYFSITHAVAYRRWSTKKMFYLAVAVSWIGAAVMGFCVYYTCLKSSPNPEVLCLVTVERTNDTLTVVAIFMVNVPCTLLFLYAYIMIFKVILKSVSSSILTPLKPHNSLIQYN